MILNDYLRIVLRRWWLLLLPLLVVAAVTAWSYKPPTITHVVKMRFTVGLPPEQVPNVYNFDRHYDWLASEYFTRGIQDILQTSKFAEGVLARLGAAGIAPAQIQSAVRSDYRASVIDVFVTWADADTAVKIAQALTDELSQNGAAYWAQLSNAQTSIVRPLDKPIAIPQAVGLTNRFDLPVRLAFGVAAGIALTLIAHYFDKTLRNAREVEQMGIRVLGEIGD